MTAAKPSPPTDSVPRNGERLRLGLTGLGAIFLIVIIVAAGLKPAAPPTEAARQGESLAVLGVAPGAGQVTPPSSTQPAVSPAPLKSGR